jgi:hypothetical protein
MLPKEARFVKTQPCVGGSTNRDVTRCGACCMQHASSIQIWTFHQGATNWPGPRRQSWCDLSLARNITIVLGYYCGTQRVQCSKNWQASKRSLSSANLLRLLHVRTWHACAAPVVGTIILPPYLTTLTAYHGCAGLHERGSMLRLLCRNPRLSRGSMEHCQQRRMLPEECKRAAGSSHTGSSQPQWRRNCYCLHPLMPRPMMLCNALSAALENGLLTALRYHARGHLRVLLVCIGSIQGS